MAGQYVLIDKTRIMLLKTIGLFELNAAKLYHKGLAEALRDAAALELRIGRQAAAVGRVIFPADERQQIAPARGGDTESVGRDEIARNFLFLIRDGRQR